MQLREIKTCIINSIFHKKKQLANCEIVICRYMKLKHKKIVTFSAQKGNSACCCHCKLWAQD